MCLCTLPSFAGGYKGTHLEQDRVFAVTTLPANMPDPGNPSVVGVDSKGDIVWKFRQSMRGAVPGAAPLNEEPAYD